ncbi:MAG TPA: carboxypeptidase regulatory-like domain-containing protein, partial [Gemmatimonadaceae bacterium]|nr:carboxypeptidase regulatory-like domain-containing protein [Gemmatimonadaceae bacterium]
MQRIVLPSHWSRRTSAARTPSRSTTPHSRSFTTLRRFLAALLLVAPGVLLGQAQATTGIIRGVARDSAGAPVANATVTVRNLETNFTRNHMTNDLGVFVATLLPLGTYEVQIRALGFVPVTRQGIRVRVGESVDIPLVMARQAVELAGVTVTGEQPLVNTTQPESATRLSDDVVEGLPNNGRNYLNLTLLTPNVAIVQGPDGDEISIGGQRGIHNNVAVDGADFNNPFFGEQRGGQRPAFTFNLDAVQEMVVISQGANAEFGRSGGGFVNVITKSGTNEFRGTVHYFGKYDALSGSPAHENITFEPDFTQHQFGFTAGGPIVRDRAFFFVAYDQQAYDEVKQRVRPDSPQFDSLRTFLGTAFGGALANDFGPVSRTNDANALLVKLDWRLNP